MKVCNSVAFCTTHPTQVCWILIPGFRAICREILPSNQKQIFTSQRSRSAVYGGKNLRIKLEEVEAIPVAVRSKA